MNLTVCIITKSTEAHLGLFGHWIVAKVPVLTVDGGKGGQGAL
jgi:hypothetical protein